MSARGWALVESVDGEEGFRYFLVAPTRAEVEAQRAALEDELGLPLLAVPLP